MFFYQRYVVSVLSNIWYICTLSHENTFMIQSCQRVPSSWSSVHIYRYDYNQLIKAEIRVMI